nr:PREDICTED: cytoskeleton-associated protein 5 [Bemisia tabaci]XP_018902746.1 PREDICTED: cytoskeleton-associated protein 5 [Bemisia tabaci]XP_018902747.1 PREDICTED: cytoskeleton-associated protein 5 [Bemisia tabaci]XP_018902749.1 PREDICTED: cytoskeleton-associated protein 5 [Bemisia tabaci]
MEEDTEYLKLPIEDQCVHKLWKARVHGYEEAKKLFSTLDEKSPEWNKYLGLIKKFVTDSNAVAQEKGLEATLAFVENAGPAGKTVGDTMAGIVNKCIAAPKTKTKDLAAQVTLMYIEIEKQEQVQEELMKGFEHKNPKTVAACVSVMTQAVREFGIKIFNVKTLVKKIPALLEDRDKNVREEGKAMVIEMYRWIGMALKPQLSNLKPVQIAELEPELEKMRNEPAVPTRYLRSQQEKQAYNAVETESGAGGDFPGEGCDGDEKVEIDPYDLMDPVDILSKLPKDFYSKLEEKKWQERKDALTTLEQILTDAPKLENGDYGDLVRALKKILTKDSNIVVVSLAAKCAAMLASGLKKRFQPYSAACLPSFLEKFREKKQSVVLPLRDAVDAIYNSTTLEAIQEDVIAALDNKNPSVKAEVAAFLGRCFCKCTPTILNKKLLKVYSAALLKTLNESDPLVRDSSADALGVAMKVVGEKVMMPFLPDVDALKLGKIKEGCEKAVITAKVTKTRDERPASAAPKVEEKPKAGSVAPKPVKRPIASGTITKSKSSLAKKTITGSTSNLASKSVKSTAAKTPPEREITDEEFEEKCESLLPPNLLNHLTDSSWKTRLAAAEQFLQLVESIGVGEAPSQVLFKVLTKKPGLKDNNFQVLKFRLDTLKRIAEKFPISSTALNIVLTDTASLLGDPKNGSAAAEALTLLAEASRLDLVSTEVLNYAFNTQKNPKVQQETLNWMSNAILEFGFVMEPKSLMDNVKKAVNATNVGVRSAGISLLGTMYLYMGQQLSMFFENDKAALVQQINTEFSRRAGETPPVPIRGKGAKQAESRKDADDDVEEEVEVPKVKIQDIVPRVDIRPQITDSLINELGDKNWKVRDEALDKLKVIITEARFISNGVGEAAALIQQRLSDSNAKITASALNLVIQIASAMGSSCKMYTSIFIPGVLKGLGDPKSFIHDPALKCLNTWGETCGFRELFDGEMIADALKSGSPALRSELWAWLTEKLPTLKSVPKEELTACLPTLYANLEDRNADVRKNSNEVIVPIMTHIGYQAMAAQVEKLKPASVTTIKGILDKNRAYVPIPEKPSSAKTAKSNAAPATASKPQNAASKQGAAPSVKSGGALKTKAATLKPVSRKKDEDIDSSPLLQVNSQKNQRSIDEHKMKVIKWNFTTPREEFFELLKEQMTTANVNKTLIANMFHADFKYHLKAIDLLNDDLMNNIPALKANLDLILKWMTLRFFDTNPSVLLKGLEYLQTVFSVLIEEQYQMLEFEASAFIPYLVLKVGDPKDAVRNSVKAIFKLIGSIYSVSKLFTYIMDGLKSKNARQRTECLEQLSWLIENFGISVCQPTPAAALKEVARQISDRDNGVRSAALNCVVAAYFLEGEKVLKMVGQISDKDMSLLEERIKRMSRNRPVASVRPIQQTPQASRVPVQPEPQMQPTPMKQTFNNADSESDEEQNYAETTPPLERRTSPKPLVEPHFSLDSAILEQIEATPVRYHIPKLAELDLNFLSEPHVMSPSKRKPEPVVSPLRPMSAGFYTSPIKNENSKVEKIISNLYNANVDTSVNAIKELDAVFNSDQEALGNCVEQIVFQLAKQLDLLSESNHSELVQNYNAILSFLLKLYNHPQLCTKASEGSLQQLLIQLISLLIEKKGSDNSTGMFVRAVNSLVFRVIDRSDHSNVICALLKLLHLSISSDKYSAHFQELVMKCVWKLLKKLPEWSDEIDYDRILFVINAFMKEYPSSFWKQQDSDTPLRTFKTVLHTMVKCKGTDLYVHIRKVANHPGENSELVCYANKLFKHLKVEEHASNENGSKKSENEDGKTSNGLPKTHLSKQVQDQLTNIFQKIGSQEETKVGLNLLYDLMCENPDISIEPHLSKSSKFFQDYIHQGLQTIKEERKKTNRLDLSGKEGESKTFYENNGNFEGKNDDGDEFLRYKKRLEGLQAQFSSTPKLSALSPNPKISQNNDSNSLFASKNINSNKQTDSSAELTFEAIQQRLARVQLDHPNKNLFQ